MTAINIFGTDYNFKFDNLNNPDLAQNDGICKIYDKEIIVREAKYLPGEKEESRKNRQDHVIRHELIHAVAQETGVKYGDNEDLVDWIAHIIPIVNKAYTEIISKNNGGNNNV